MPIKNSVYDYETNADKFYGIYRGVVECRFDAELLCRCRIRVWGVHDELKDKTSKRGVPTEELPWAEPAFGLYQGSVSGNGQWCVPLQGSYVWVFFENGNWMHPRYFASAPGLPIQAPIDEGFNDPMMLFPDADWIGEPDTHRLMKRDKLGLTTLIEVKLPNIDEAIDIAFAGTWDEQPPMYQAKYPFNSMTYSHSGIYVEIDDTIEHRRWHLYHPSNSYMEWGELGELILRNHEKRWDICDDMKFEHVMNDYHRKIDTNRTSLVMLDQWDEIYLNRYGRIHKNEHREILENQISHIFEDEFRYIDLTRYVHIYLDEYKIIDIDKIEMVGGNRVNLTYGTNIDFTQGFKHIRSDDVIHLQSATEIILDAPIVTLKANKFNDQASQTNISQNLKWGGIADGDAKFAELAKEALLANSGSVSGTVKPNNITPEPPVAPAAPPEPSIPAPPDIPPPPPPPPIIEYDYDDIPPEEDPCPPLPCPDKDHIIV